MKRYHYPIRAFLVIALGFVVAVVVCLIVLYAIVHVP